MKYLKDPLFGYRAIEEGSDEYAALVLLDEARRPVFFESNDPLVVAFLTAQAEASKPKEVTMRQARLALLEAGLLTNVESAIAAMPGPTGAAARIEWEYSSVLKRSQPLVAAMSAVLSITPAQMDGLFLSASLK